MSNITINIGWKRQHKKYLPVPQTPEKSQCTSLTYNPLLIVSLHVDDRSLMHYPRFGTAILKFAKSWEKVLHGKKLALYWRCEGRQCITQNVFSFIFPVVKSLMAGVKGKILQMPLTPTLNSNCSLIISNSVRKCTSL